MTILKNALLAGAGALALAAVAAPAQAQVQQPGFFGYLQGWYWLDSGNDHPNDIPKVSPDDGFGGKAYAGFQGGKPFDIALGLQYNDISKGKKGGFSQDATYWAGDVEAGYTFIWQGAALRPFLGARYAQFDHNTKGAGLKNDTDYWGVGPRVGIDGAVRLGQSNFSIFGGVAGSYLFGKQKEKLTGAGSDKKSADVWQIDGQIGVGYEVAQNFTIAAGYRADYWNGVADKSFTTVNANSSNDRFMHGPFVRLAYNFGAPRRVTPVAAPMPAPAPAPAPVARKNFLVFFDFDKSTITAEGARTISDAAAAAKAGQNARLSVTGHADRSGSEQYNMALSMRRANAVKDALVRQGVPANQIAIFARGESQPLVPTADGVREPQNRRVEIVIE